jgi:hypothetical protein
MTFNNMREKIPKLFLIEVEGKTGGFIRSDLKN